MRYFFDLRVDTHDQVDRGGRDLPDVDAARREIIRIAVEMASALTDDDQPQPSRRSAVITVRDGHGIIAQCSLGMRFA